MDTSNNYINQNQELRDVLLNILFGDNFSIPAPPASPATPTTPTNDLNPDNSETEPHNPSTHQATNLFNIGLEDPIVGRTTSDIDNDYINFFRNYFFRNRGPIRNSIGGPTLQSILQSSFMDPSQNLYKKVLSKEGENAIKTVKFKKGQFPNDTCPVTLTDFTEDEEVSQLPCGHIFVKEAVLKWLKDENATCPVCRKPLASKEVKKENKNVVLPNLTVPPPVNRTTYRRNFMQNYIERQIQREEEAELQAAIIASLRDQTS